MRLWVPPFPHRTLLLHHLTPCFQKWDPPLKVQAATSTCCCASYSAVRSWPEAPRWAPKRCRTWLPRCCRRTGPARQSSCSQTCRLKPRHWQKHIQRLWQKHQLRGPPATIQVSPFGAPNWFNGLSSVQKVYLKWECECKMTELGPTGWTKLLQALHFKLKQMSRTWLELSQLVRWLKINQLDNHLINF